MRNCSLNSLKRSVLIVWLTSVLSVSYFEASTVAYAAPEAQSNPETQCAEGVQLFLDGMPDQARPLLEAGYAGRSEVSFDEPESLGHCALALGELRANTWDPTGSVEAYTTALDAFQQSGDRALEGITQSYIADQYTALRRTDEALAAQQEALTIFRELNDQRYEGATLSKIGLIYAEKGQIAEALAAMQRALAILHGAGDRHNEGATLNNIGEIYIGQEHYAEALEALQQALVITRELGDRPGEGVTLSNIGEVYAGQNRHADALDMYQQALVILREVGNRRGESITLANLGQLYSLQGDYTEALDTFQQSLVITRELSNRAVESISLLEIGEVYYHQGQYAQALEMYQQALALAVEIGDAPTRGVILNNIGGVYHSQGRHAEALEAFEQALAIAREAGSKSAERTTLNNMGDVYRREGRHAEAIAAFERALMILRELGDTRNQSTPLNNLGLVYLNQGRLPEALEVFQQALVILREAGDRPNEGKTLIGIGSVLDEQGRHAEALSSFQQALAVLQEVDDRLYEGYALNNIGRLFVEQGRFVEALEQYERAMDVMETARSNAGSELGRASFIAQYADLYEYAALLYQDQGKSRLAFRTSERGRGRAFLDSLASGQVQLADQDAAVVQREQEAYAARQALREALARAHSTAAPDQALITDLEQQLQMAEQQHAEALAAIERRGDELAALVPSRTKGVLDVAAVQERLDPQTTLVSFFVTPDQTLAFVLTHDRFQTVALFVGRDALREHVSRLLDAPEFQTAAHPAAATKLYTTLIAPLKSLLTTSHLVIVPHGPLHYLPFAALSDGQHFLGEEYLLSTLPSASTLPFIQSRSGRSPTPPLILGNPDGSLPFAEREAVTIARLYGVQPLLGSEATEGALRENAAQAGILHLAAHGRYDAFTPLASQLTLAPSSGTGLADADGRLEAAEVYGLNLQQTDLVVLSACQTNLGELSGGDEVVGLTRAFFFAGAPTVISSLWSVDDAATAELMERFYRHWRAGLGKAAALRVAQREVRATYPAPYYWAGFVLAGDVGSLGPPDTRFPISVAAGIWLVLAMLAGLLGFMLWRVLRRRSGGDNPAPE